MAVVWKAAPTPPLIDSLYDELVPLAYQAVVHAFDLGNEEVTVQHLTGLMTVTREAFSKAAPDLRELNEAAARWAEQSAARLVQGINKETKKALARTIAYGIKNGWKDDEYINAVARKVGLGDRYAAAVENYRLALIQKGTAPGDARRLAQAYAQRLRSHRALAIAKTEVQSALINAQRELWIDGVDRGDIPTYAHRKWQVHKDERLCPQCRPLHGKVVPLGKGSYNAAGITVIGPPLHPNCRCFEELTNARGTIIKAGVRHVRTHAGKKKYGQPIGTVITRDMELKAKIKAPRTSRTQREQENLKQREVALQQEQNKQARNVVRDDDLRILQGQTPNYMFHPGTVATGDEVAAPGRVERALSKTESGDIPEALFNERAAGMVASFLGTKGHGQMAGVAGQRNIPLDHVIGGEGGSQRWAAEIKSVSANAPDNKVGIRFASKTLKYWAIEDDKLANPRRKSMLPLIIGQKIHQNKDGSGRVEVFVYQGAYDSPYFTQSKNWTPGKKGRNHLTKIGEYSYTSKEWKVAAKVGKVNGGRKRKAQGEAERRLQPQIDALKRRLREGKVRKEEIFVDVPVDTDVFGDPIYEFDTILDFNFDPPAIYVADPQGIPPQVEGATEGRASSGSLPPT